MRPSAWLCEVRQGSGEVGLASWHVLKAFSYWLYHAIMPSIMLMFAL
jgi:hypothetical protein